MYSCDDRSCLHIVDVLLTLILLGFFVVEVKAPYGTEKSAKEEEKVSCYKKAARDVFFQTKIKITSGAIIMIVTRAASQSGPSGGAPYS